MLTALHYFRGWELEDQQYMTAFSWKQPEDGVVSILNILETETEPRRWLQSKLSILRSSSESWRIICFFFCKASAGVKSRKGGWKGPISLMNRAERSQPPTYYMAFGKPLPVILNLVQRVNGSVSFLCKICKILFSILLLLFCRNSCFSLLAGVFLFDVITQFMYRFIR